MSGRRRSTRISVPPARFRFSHFAKAPPVPRGPAVKESAAALASAPTLAVHEDPLDQLKQFLSRAGGFAVVDDYHSSDEAESFVDQ